MKSKILYEDDAVLVCEKPVGMLVQSNRSLDTDMINELKNYIYKNLNNNKEPYIGLIHRLDRPVGGVLVFAKTQTAAKVLSLQVQGETDNTSKTNKSKVSKMEKQYYAVVDKDLTNELGNAPKELVNYLIKDAKTNTSKVTTVGDKNGKKAILSYQVLDVSKDEEGEPVSLVEVTLKTGRHHQIRVQMAHNDMPLWGDTKYNQGFVNRQQNNANLKWANVGLYSHHLAFDHPVTKRRMEFNSAPKEGVFSNFRSLVQ